MQNNPYAPYIDTLSETTTNLVNPDEIKRAFANAFDNMQSRDRPRFFGIGGGVAAGKSTLLKKLIAMQQVPDDAFIHDPDLVMLKWPGYQRMCQEKGMEAAQKIYDAPTLEIAEAMLKYATDHKIDTVYMRTFSADNIVSYLPSVAEKGYEMTAMHGVFTDPEAIVARITKREHTEGRTVPNTEAFSKTGKFLANFKDCANCFNHVCLWDNRGNEPVLAMEKPVGAQEIWTSYEAKACFEKLVANARPNSMV